MPFGEKERRKIFGDFKHKNLGGGRIKILGYWTEENIVSFDCPVLGKIRFHVKGKVQLEKAMQEVFTHQETKKEILIDLADFHSSGGTFVPRHRMWKDGEPLSPHSWGIAIDCNVMYGKDGKGGSMNIYKNSFQPEVLKNIMQKYGFEWGGDWKSFKDGMHFEISELLGWTSSHIKVVLNNVLVPIEAEFGQMRDVLYAKESDLNKFIIKQGSTFHRNVPIRDWLQKNAKGAILNYNQKQNKLYIYFKKK